MPLNNFERLLAKEKELLRGFEQTGLQQPNRTVDGIKPARSAFLAEKPQNHVYAAKDVAFEGDNDPTRVAFHSEMPNLPLLGQLLSHSQVIVRIRPWTIDQFVERFGIRPDQMAYLAREGWVVPALYSHNKLEEYERLHHLHELFDVKKNTGAQIDYIRQKAFMPQDADAYGAGKRQIVRNQLEKLDPYQIHWLTDADRPELNRNGEIEDGNAKHEFLDSATAVISRHLSYLNAFTELSGKAEMLTLELRNQKLPNWEAYRVMTRIMTLSRSNVHPLSGAFGGHLEPDKRFIKFWEYPKNRPTKTIDQETLAKLELEFQKKNVRFLELERCPNGGTKAPDDEEWGRIMLYLKELHADEVFREKKRVARTALRQVIQNQGFLDTAEAVEDVFLYLGDKAKRAIRMERFGDTLVAGISKVEDAAISGGPTIGAALGVLTDNSKDAYTGAFVGTIVGQAAAVGVSHWLCSYKSQLVQRMSGRFAPEGKKILEAMDRLALGPE